ncbi:MAG: hypothetical protein CMI03_05545 [Oceanospirillaceae bacterium]|mgnify:CR=1 FL=1|nr:hypothetical protein [Oceanospirillaceae bacterium]MBL35668.1 hypothetical protein [Oceanospirillaceae bacterium]MBS52197.1 hypothetical protein [Oceanospirillaceae bacterium]
MKCPTIICILMVPGCALAMQSLDDQEMSQVTGEGIAAVFDNVLLNSADYSDPESFKIKLKLTDGPDPDYMIFSELRMYKSGSTEESGMLAGRFGTYDDPFYIADIREITERHTGLIDPLGNGSLVSGNRTHTALYMGFPTADLQQLERSFASFSDHYYEPASEGADIDYYRGLPQDFFTDSNSVDVSYLPFLSTSFAEQSAQRELELDQATDKFDLHFRVDMINDTNRNSTEANASFLTYADLEGVRLYGTSAYLWAHSGQGETLSAAELANYQYGGQPFYGDRGLSLAMTTGLQADVIRLTTDPEGALASSLELRGVDMYLPLGNADQPLTISTVQYAQVERGTWKDAVPNVLAPTTQLRIEIGGLPQDVAQAPQGNIYIQSIAFGDESDPDLITGYEDIFLRDADGNIVSTISNVSHRAFIPKTVIYNEQVAAYNQANPGNEIPYVPNQNVVEIKGIEIQRLIITTQDL